jgi:hypothetical protein
MFSREAPDAAVPLAELGAASCDNPGTRAAAAFWAACRIALKASAASAETEIFGALFEAGFLADLPAAAFAALRVVPVTAFWPDFLAVLRAAFLPCLTARFCAAAGLLARFAAFLAFFFFADFLATMKILENRRGPGLFGIDDPDAYCVASASSENTEKTSGFRSRL